MKIHFFLAFLLVSASMAFGASPNAVARNASAPRINQDDVWAVIEYPEGREVVVDLASTATMPTARGTARVTRDSNGAHITLELSGLSAEVENYYAYAIDSLGNATALGTLTVSEGFGSLSTQSALTRFMLIISATDDIVTFTAETPNLLRSRVPEGYQVIPRGNPPEAATEMTPSASDEETSMLPDYEVPLLGISSLRRGRATQFKARLFDEAQGSRVNASVMTGKNNATQVTLTIRDLKPAPDGGVYVAWAVSPDKAYSVLGKMQAGKESKLVAATEFSDFGLFVTVEDSESTLIPTGKMVVMIVR